jgi:hypothetical protein
VGSPASPAVAIPGLRAPGRFRPWSSLVEAVDLTLNRPSLWLLGAAGFLIRGGLVLLLVPLVVLPSPVEVRLLIGEGLGSAGFSGGLLTVAAVTGIVVSAVLLAAMLALAWLEIWALERTVDVAQPRRLVGRDRRRVVSWVFIAQAGALLLIAAATLPLVAQATTVAYREIINPSSDGPLYMRVLAGAEPQLLMVAVAIFVAEAVSAVATRTILGRAVGAPVPPRRRRWRPAVALLGWTVSLGVLAPGLWALTAIGHWSRAVLLGSSAASDGPLMTVLAVVVLVAAWGGILLLAGFASGLRGALWSMQELG